MKDIRDKLAILLTVCSMTMLGYALIKYGDRPEILTLILGLVGGTTLGGVVGYYFSASHKDKPDSTATLTVTETKQTTKEPTSEPTSE